MEIKKACVLGAGIMGSGIAQVVAAAGFEVTMRDIEDRFVEKGSGNNKISSRPCRGEGKDRG